MSITIRKLDSTSEGFGAELRALDYPWPLRRWTLSFEFLRDADKRKYIETGLQEADKALALKSDYQDAMTFKNLLLRSLALVETNRAKQQALIKEADALKAKAEEMQKAKAAAPAAAAPTKG